MWTRTVWTRPLADFVAMPGFEPRLQARFIDAFLLGQVSEARLIAQTISIGYTDFWPANVL